MRYQSNFKTLMRSFIQLIYQIKKDAMLFVMCMAPILCGVFMKYGIPFAEKLLTEYFNKKEILAPYYLLFDLMIAMMTPMLFCFIAAYTILGEIDDGISKYLAVTPVGKKGYLISRIGFPTIVSFFLTILLLFVFTNTEVSFTNMVVFALLSSAMSIVEAMLIVSLSHNKVEGIALSKLCGIMLLGMPAPFFVHGSIQYLLFFLPSFWLGKYAITGDIFCILLSLLFTTLLILLLYKRFSKKL